MIIDTPRLQLMACDMAVIDAILISDEALADLLGIQVTPSWSTFGRKIFEYSKKLNCLNSLKKPTGELTFRFSKKKTV